jgi:hypothetical protein
MTRPNFINDEIFFPLTLEQYESLVNEIFTEVQGLTAPQGINPDDQSETMISVLHGYDKAKGVLSKADLFERCVRYLSSRMTYNIGLAMQARKKAAQESNHLEVVPPIVVEPDSILAAD